MSMMDPNTANAVRPVFALMGEFSAGKSTLANLLLGEGSSPVKVTATQLPPVWYTHGTGSPVVVDLEGVETEIEKDAIESVDIATTAYIRIKSEAEILELIDLIDMPGNSDPNMSADVWKRAIHHADAVIWCTHANQAWRQSEAAVWEELPDELHTKSILLLTRFDKILGEKDRARVLRRVQIETDGLFRYVLPISLIDALSAAEDREKWEASGAETFTQALLDVVMTGSAQEEDAPLSDPAAGPVIPRRVQRAGGNRRPTRDRPPADEAQQPTL